MTSVATDFRILGWPAFRNQHQNPYNFLLYSSIQRLGARVEEFSVASLLFHSYSVLHIHWPEAAMTHRKLGKAVPRAFYFLFCLIAAKIKGARIIWTVHNLQAHEQNHPRFASFYLKMLLKLVDHLIFMSQSGQTEMRKLSPKAASLPSAIIPHGHYRDIYPAPPTKHNARNTLHIPNDSFVVGFVGALRKYKNVTSLMSSFKKLNLPGKHLIVAGSVEKGDLLTQIQDLAEGETNIFLLPHLLSDSEIQDCICAADIIILPYSKILNSGASLLALSLNRPVLVPAKGAMPELQASVGAEWVMTYEGEFDLSILEANIQKLTSQKLPGKAELGFFDWDLIAEKTLGVFQHSTNH